LPLPPFNISRIFDPGVFLFSFFLIFPIPRSETTGLVLVSLYCSAPPFCFSYPTVNLPPPFHVPYASPFLFLRLGFSSTCSRLPVPPTPFWFSCPSFFGKAPLISPDRCPRSLPFFSRPLGSFSSTVPSKRCPGCTPTPCIADFFSKPSPFFPPHFVC